MSVPRVDAAIVGVHKCGTTSLFAAIARHPLVDAPHAKESRAFTLPQQQQQRALAALYPAPDARLRLFAYAHAIGLPDSLRAMMRHNPKMRLLVSLRDPVQRAWSAYHFARRNGWETLDLDDALDIELVRRSGSHSEHTDLQYVANSRYAELLSRLFTIVPREQVAVVQLAGLAAAHDDALTPVWQHLGLPDAPLGPLPALNPAGRPRWPLLQHALLGEGRLKRSARRLLPPSLKVRLHRHVTAPLLHHNVVAEPLPAMTPSQRQRLSDAVADDQARLASLLAAP